MNDALRYMSYTSTFTLNIYFVTDFVLIECNLTT